MPNTSQQIPEARQDRQDRQSRPISPEEVSRAIAAGLTQFFAEPPASAAASATVTDPPAPVETPAAPKAAPKAAPQARTLRDIFSFADSQKNAERAIAGTPTKVSLVAERIEVESATWDSTYKSNLPDAAFAAVEPGGTKDADGKTTPRSLRHLPHHDKSVSSATEQSSVDIPHLKNAVQRLPQSNLPSSLKSRAGAHLQAHVRAAIKDGKMAGPAKASLAAADYETLLDLNQQLAVFRATAADDSGGDGNAAVAPDDYWGQERTRLGIVEDHDNAMFLVVTLTHTDTVMRNYMRDVIPLEEAQASLATLLFQPIDIADEMDCHERERLYCYENGIRGVIYAARIVGTAIQIGVILWATDFPDIAAKVLEFRDSLGASFDLLAYDYDLVPDEPDTEVEGNAATQIRYRKPTEGYESDTTANNRVLKKIVFLGGSILTKVRAADPTTSIDDLRYGGKSADELLDGSMMMGDNNQNTGNGAQANQGQTPAATPAPPAQQATPHDAMVAALAAAQAQAAEHAETIKRLTTEMEVERQKAALAETNLTNERAARETLQGEFDRVKAESDQIKAQAEAVQKAGERLQELDKIPAGLPHCQNVPAFESEEKRNEAFAALQKADDAAFLALKSNVQLDVLQRAVAQAQAGAAQAQPAGTPKPAASQTSAQAAATVPPPSPLSGGTAPDTSQAAGADGVSLGRGIAAGLRDKPGQSASAN